jgi:hypothetical protein
MLLYPWVLYLILIKSVLCSKFETKKGKNCSIVMTDKTGVETLQILNQLSTTVDHINDIYSMAFCMQFHHFYNP